MYTQTPLDPAVCLPGYCENVQLSGFIIPMSSCIIWFYHSNAIRYLWKKQLCWCWSNPSWGLCKASYGRHKWVWCVIGDCQVSYDLVTSRGQGHIPKIATYGPFTWCRVHKFLLVKTSLSKLSSRIHNSWTWPVFTYTDLVTFTSECKEVANTTSKLMIMSTWTHHHGVMLVITVTQTFKVMPQKHIYKWSTGHLNNML